MDTNEIFQQLVKGVRFTKKKLESNPVKLIPTNLDSEMKVYEEKFRELKKQQQNFDATEFSMDLVKEEPMSPVSLEPKTSELKSFKKMEELNLKRKNSIIDILRRENCISAIGKDIPAPITTFDELESEYKVNNILIQNLIKYNYTVPTPIQMQAIPALLQFRPVMAIAPTGSGKTIAYLVPILNELGKPSSDGYRAIVLAPTRELAMQIYKECVRLSRGTGLKIRIITKKFQNSKSFNHKMDMLVSTPNRIRYMLQSEPPLINLNNVRWIVIDEADRLLESGSEGNFKEQLDIIIDGCASKDKKLVLFSATSKVEVEKWTLKHTKFLARITVGQLNSATTTVDQQLLFVGSESGKLLAIRNLIHNGLQPPVLIFVQSKDRAKQLFSELLFDGINVDLIHGERSQQQRDNVVRAFREGKIWVLICTELLSRGIDFKGINLIINYDFPPTVISYIHRVGRAGRAGKRGTAITYFTQSDLPLLPKIAKIIENCGGTVPEFINNMQAKKSEIRLFAKRAPKREDISTKLKSSSSHTKSENSENTQEIERKKKIKKYVKIEGKKSKSHKLQLRNESPKTFEDDVPNSQNFKIERKKSKKFLTSKQGINKILNKLNGQIEKKK